MLLGGVVAFLPSVSDVTASEKDDVRVFFESHCIECHGTESQEGGIRLDTLEFPSPQHQTSLTWQRVVDAVERGEMPPTYQPQPEDGTKRAIVQKIVQIAAESRRPSNTLRRLNRVEYENTVHDLLGVDVPLAKLLPEDGTANGFNKSADGLSFSAVQMEQYLEAANVAFDAVIRRYAPLPPETRHANVMSQAENIEFVKKRTSGVKEVDGSYVRFHDRYPPVFIDNCRPIEDGVYRCRVAVWPYQPDGRMIAVALYTGAMFNATDMEFVGVFDVTGTSKSPRVIEFTKRMSAGEFIHILPKIWPKPEPGKDKDDRRGVAIAWAETYGPLDQSFPSESTKKLFGDAETIQMDPVKPVWVRSRNDVYHHVVNSSEPEADIKRILHDFVPRAFRRPVSEEEIRPFIDLALANFASTKSFERAVRTGVTAVLCSPRFLLINSEPVVDDFSIASRMSYFLWSTMPDQELLDLAKAGKLMDPETRAAQVERMIADPKSERFVTDFTNQWLDLSEIEFTTPDKTLYPEYDPLLLDGMLRETRSFFRYMLAKDVNVRNFIDSDFAFLNERMAVHYGLPHVVGHEEFRKVTLPAESIRGGILTQASIMKVTANGTTTSPVIRGVWVAEKLLGRSIPPPPPGVPAVEPDIRGATSIREQLDKHRNNAACASCHKRIDPAGFALEEFDPIGLHRPWYRVTERGRFIARGMSFRAGPAIDSSFEFANGKKFQDFEEFREQLLENDRFVKRAIAEKLMVYATGRSIDFRDLDDVEQVVRESAKNDYGLQSMIRAVIASDLFVAP